MKIIKAAINFLRICYLGICIESGITPHDDLDFYSYANFNRHN
ncbi:MULTISPECIES: hypothetical protein [unclassified Paenibacillus]